MSPGGNTRILFLYAWYYKIYYKHSENLGKNSLYLWIFTSSQKKKLSLVNAKDIKIIV